MVRLDRKCGISLYFIYGIFDFVFVLLLYTSFFTNHEQLKRWKIETTDYRVIVVDFVLIAGARLACVFAFLACSCLCAAQRFFFVVMRLVVVFTATISGVYSFAKLLAAADLVPAHTLTKTFWGLFAWNLVSSVIFGLAFYYFVDKPLERPLKRTIKTSPRLKDPKLLQDDIDEKDSAEELRHSNSVVDYVSLPYSGSQPDTAAKIEELLGYARTVKRLLSYAKREFCLYICGFFFVLVYVGAYTLIPYYIGSVIGDIVVSKNYDKLLVSVAIMGGLNFAAAISAGLIEGILRYANAKVNVRIRGDLFGSFLSQEIGFFDTTKTGDITSRLTADTQQMSDAIGTNLDIFLRNCLLCFGSLGFMFGLCWQLTLLNFIALPLYGLATQLYGRWYESLQRGVQDSLAYVNELADEILSSMRTVRSFANEQNEVDAYTGRLQLMLGFKLRQSVSFVGHIWTAQLFDTALMVAVLWYGGHLVFKEQLDSRGLIQFLLYQIQIGQCLLSMGRVYTGLMAAVGASRKVFSHIDRKPHIDYNGKVKLPSFSGKIELRNVTFAYPTRPNLPVIRNMSISIEPGEVVALVGPSGGGKSSVIALLEHFYEPIAGSIAIDSVPLGKFDHKFLHNRMALVSQEPTLYARSVADNIRYGFDLQESDEQSLARVVDVAKLANAHDFVSALPLGYSTETGEKGVQLSGGQKQRIAIARALIRDPKILLLDEATSALDAESEYLVQQAIHRNMGGRTVILIAHRLSTVEQADRIIVINAGRVVQQGSHTSLLAQEGMYRSLVQRQLLATGDDADNTLPPLPAPSTGGDSMSRRTTPADWDENNFYSARSNRSYASSTEHEDHVGLV